ncbi:MAG: purine/pyrimidine permease [Akkermansiaceae bacterium]|nr:purine/pyrimidine permease [Akkermansiaceae bacterium]
MSRNLLYGIDDKPPLPKAMALGFQQYLTMFGSTVVIPIILVSALGANEEQTAIRDNLGVLIGTIFFVSGVCTLLQTTVGNRLPIVQGGTFSFFAPTFAILGLESLAQAGFEVRMQHLQGAIIGGALVQIVLGYTGLVGRMMRFIGPIVIAPTIALIGLALFRFGATQQGAGNFWPIGILTIGLLILFSQYLRKVHPAFAMYPIILGIGGAWAIAWVLTATGVFPAGHPAHVSFEAVAAAPWLRAPHPFQWGTPVFVPGLIVGMLAGYLASVIESVGDYYACARLAGAPVPDKKVINRGIGMEGVGCVIAGIFGTGNGTTSYSENIGAIGLTRVGSRFVIQVGAMIMMVLAVFGKFGALFASIPQPVIGGIYCVMFGMIASVGLSNLQFVDLNSARNLFIIGFALFMGISLPEYFERAEGPVTIVPGAAFAGLNDILLSICRSGMSVGAIIALVLDNTIPGTDEERGIVAWHDKMEH